MDKGEVTAVKLDEEKSEDVRRSTDIFGSSVLLLRSFVCKLVDTNQKVFTAVVVTVLAILFHMYLAAVVSHAKAGETIDWCDGAGFLYILTVITYWGLFYYFVLKRYCKQFFKCVCAPLRTAFVPVSSSPYVSTALSVLCVVTVSVYLLYDCWNDQRRLTSAGGILAIVAIGLLISKHPGRVNWRSVVLGISLQLSLGLVMLRWPAGRDGSMCLSGKVFSFND